MSCHQNNADLTKLQRFKLIHVARTLRSQPRLTRRGLAGALTLRGLAMLAHLRTEANWCVHDLSA